MNKVYAAEDLVDMFMDYYYYKSLKKAVALVDRIFNHCSKEDFETLKSVLGQLNDTNNKEQELFFEFLIVHLQMISNDFERICR